MRGSMVSIYLVRDELPSLTRHAFLFVANFLNTDIALPDFSDT